jgi:hypothetical protein
MELHNNLRAEHLVDLIKDELDKKQQEKIIMKESAIAKYAEYIEKLHTIADGKFHTIYAGNNSHDIKDYILKKYPGEYTQVYVGYIDLLFIHISYVAVQFYDESSFNAHAHEVLKLIVDKMKEMLVTTYKFPYGPVYTLFDYHYLSSYNKLFNEYGYNIEIDGGFHGDIVVNIIQ